MGYFTPKTPLFYFYSLSSTFLSHKAASCLFLFHPMPFDALLELASHMLKGGNTDIYLIKFVFLPLHIFTSINITHLCGGGGWMDMTLATRVSAGAQSTCLVIVPTNNTCQSYFAFHALAIARIGPAIMSCCLSACSSVFVFRSRV